MIKSTALAAAAALAFAAPAFATDVSKMTDEERAAFRAEIRAYLLDNPEVIFEAVEVFRAREAEAEAKGDAELLANNQSEIFNDGVSYVGGNPDGDVTIVEFLDYRCGYCRRAHADMLQLMAADKNVRWVVKEYPILGDDSTTSAQMAIATLQEYGPEAYARLHDVLMEFKGPVNAKTVDQIAKRADIDPAPLKDRMASKETAAHIDRMHALGRTLNITGTPAFVINGSVLRGYLPLADMQNIVAQERAKVN